MRRWRNSSWIAGVLTAVCVLAVVCFVAWPKASQPSGGSDASRQSIDINLPAERQQLADAAPSEPASQESAESAVEEAEPYGGMEYVEGIVLVTLPAGVSPAEALATISDETGIEGLALANEADASAAATTAAEAPALVELAIPADLDMQQTVNLIGTSSAVDAAQPNFIYHLSDDPDDPEAWAHDELISQNLIVQDFVTQAISATTTVNDVDSSQWMLPSIYAYNDTMGVGNAWNVVTTDKTVTVAVIDEGFQADHEDLSGNVIDTYNSVTGESGVDAVAESAGEGGHGTHVAGIVAAEANNGQGIAGASYNAKLMLIKALNSSGNFTSTTIANGIQHAIDARYTSANVRVINLSVCGKASSSSNWPDDTMIKKIDAATAAGIVVVCAAGNSKTAPVPYLAYPSDYYNAVSVISLQKGADVHDVSRLSSSNYNESKPDGTVFSGKDISAPGESIKSTMPNNSYGTKDGTSMAAPSVAGVLALVFAQQPNLSATDAMNLLYNTTTDLGEAGWDLETGYGEVNAYRAVTEPDAYVSGSTILKKGSSVQLSMQGTFTWSWGSEDTSVATVNQNGVVTGVGAGSTRISTIYRKGFAVMRAYKNVIVYDPTISGSSSIAVGSSATLSIPSTPSGSWTWTSSDASVATVSSSGTSVTVVGQKPGTTTIKVALSSNANIYSEKEITVTAADLSRATVSFSGTYTYNGSAQKPTPTVKIGSVTLAAGTDFTVTYDTSDCTNAGTKTVTIKPGTSGRLTGSKTASYTINVASLSGATVTLSQSTVSYTGSAQKPGVTVKVGSRTLTNGTDYTVSYANNVNVGTGTVKITGKGNYTSTKTASFTISAARHTLYRLYNPNSGEHHYTASSDERDFLRREGWAYEGIAWYGPSTSSTAVYRLYNPNAGDHHYTTSTDERDFLRRVGWIYEGISWYSDDAKGKPLYRLYNPNASTGTHHYTTSSDERDFLRRAGWRYEGVAWYGLS